MNKRIVHILIISAFIGTVYYLAGGLNGLLHPTTVRAFGDLTVNFHVPLGKPIFNLTNLAPGNPIPVKPVDVSNTGALARYVAVRGIRTGGTVEVPGIESAMTIAIKNGSTVLYGPKTIADFFTDSTKPDGIGLSVVPASGNKTYTLETAFPASADNKYQGKSVQFDLTFGTVTANHLVINEVYVQPDQKHGNDKPDKNDKNEENEQSQKAEWIEVYNPTASTVSLKNMTIATSKGTFKINANKTVAAGGFALLSKDASAWRFWNVPKSVTRVELGNWPKDGLGNNGDHVYLTDSKGVRIDAVSWGTDSSGFTPPAAVSKPGSGKSLGRIAAGYDTDMVSDWIILTLPTPGQ
jgi:hypothetical protein